MLRLRKIDIKDLNLIMEWRMKPEVTQFMYTDPILTNEQQKIWFDKIVQNDKNYIRIINYDDLDIGLYSITDINRNGNCFWAYYIAEVLFQGKGIGKILECNNYDYAFNVLGVHKVSCEVLSFNEKVITIHQKYGSKIEGIFKEHINKKNEYFDVVRMAILKEEWDELRKNIYYEICSFE